MLSPPPPQHILLSCRPPYHALLSCRPYRPYHIQVLVHPTCGPTQPDDIPGNVRYKTYEVRTWKERKERKEGRKEGRKERKIESRKKGRRIERKEGG